jgi:hypothetical protein
VGLGVEGGRGPKKHWICSLRPFCDRNSAGVGDFRVGSLRGLEALAHSCSRTESGAEITLGPVRAEGLSVWGMVEAGEGQGTGGLG